MVIARCRLSSVARDREGGFSLPEVLVSMAVFGVLLLALVALEREMVRYDRTIRLKFMTHPDPMSVLARLRTDVLDSTGYPAGYESWVQSDSVLILDGLDDEAKPVTIVYDFQDSGVARRLEFSNDVMTSRWVAHNVPKFEISSFEMERGDVAVRVHASTNGKPAIDQILRPRAGS